MRRILANFTFLPEYGRISDQSSHSHRSIANNSQIKRQSLPSYGHRFILCLARDRVQRVINYLSALVAITLSSLILHAMGECADLGLHSRSRKLSQRSRVLGKLHADAVGNHLQ